MQPLTPLDYALSLMCSLWGAVARSTPDHARAGVADGYRTLVDALSDPARVRVRVRAAALAARALVLALLLADAEAEAAGSPGAAPLVRDEVRGTLRWLVDGPSPTSPADAADELARAWAVWSAATHDRDHAVALGHAALRVCQARVAPEDLTRAIPWEVRGAAQVDLVRALGREHLLPPDLRRAPGVVSPEVSSAVAPVAIEVRW